jgi:hypothetical protein
VRPNKCPDTIVRFGLLRALAPKSDVAVADEAVAHEVARFEFAPPGSTPVRG